MLGIVVWHQWLLLAAYVALSFVVQRNFSNVPYIRLFTFSLGVVALSLWWFFRSRYRLRVYRSPVANLLIVLSFVWLLMGAAVNEITPYIATDWFFFIGALTVSLIARSLWRTYLVSGHIGPNECRLPNSLLATISILLATQQWTGVWLGPAFAFFLLSDLGARVMLQQARSWHIVVASGACLIAAINSNRSFLLSVISATILIVSFGFMKSRDYKLATLVMFALVIPLGLSAVMDFAATQKPDSSIARRLNETSIAIATITGGGRLEDMPIAMYQRVYEAEQVLLNTFSLDPRNPLIPILGHGFGALMDMTMSNDKSVTNSAQLGAAQVHNIHFLPFMIIFRFGVIGLLLFGYFYLNLFRQLLSYLDSTTCHNNSFFRYAHAYRFGALVFVFSNLAYSMQAASTIFDSTSFFIAAGILSYPIERLASSRRRPIRTHRLDFLKQYPSFVY